MEAFCQVSLEFIFLFINVYINVFIFDRTPTHATIGSKPTSNSVPIEHVFSTTNKPEIREVKTAHEIHLPSNSLLYRE